MIFRRIGRKPRRDLTIMNALFPAAEAAARADGLDAAGAEYLLLAALGLEDGSARRAFESLGAGPDDLRAAIRAQHAEALETVGMNGIDDTILDLYLPEPTPATGPVRTAPSAHQMFKKVLKMVQDDRSQLYSGYFVLVAIESRHGTTIRAIRHLKIDPAELGAAARSEVESLKQHSS